MSRSLRAGLDIGSTTAKLLILEADGQLAFSLYRRHASDIAGTLDALLGKAAARLGDRPLRLRVTGSAGLGLAERLGLDFVQEVVAAGEVLRSRFPEARTLVDIGGEDSKMIFLEPGRPPDIRMNGSCAGGTGAFIDQMATLLGLSLEELNALALQHREIHPIATRCGVFAKTDVQNLVSRKVDKEDICASILRAVSVQNLNSLARGRELKGPVLFCGGPLSFLPALRESLRRCMEMPEDQVLLPERSEFFPAWGAAMSCGRAQRRVGISSLRSRLKQPARPSADEGHRLGALFEDEEDLRRWEASRPVLRIPTADLADAEAPLFLGLDSGSTTSKTLVLDARGRLVFESYGPNVGRPVEAALEPLLRLRERIREGGRELPVAGSAATGYGEDLVRNALDVGMGMVETLAHWRAAQECHPDVSFILDIGGQDMKAVFVGDEGISRIEINEACSSGCGSFIEGFAQTLGYDAAGFAAEACRAEAPCDLGTRCTVFMNSRIKQAQRENASVPNIAAGLAYSVIKNSLFKVLKLRDVSELGGRIVVQGGTFRNPAVLRALEGLTGLPVSCSDRPEMMGAYGAALLAREAWRSDPASTRAFDLEGLRERSRGVRKQTRCEGCENQCPVTVFTFPTGRRYFTGNQCERVFSNRGTRAERGRNLFGEKNALLFDRPLRAREPAAGLTLGIPRVLVMYEEFPFWCSLLTGCGMEVVLSAPSDEETHQRGLGTVMADNICFPAKLAHGHVLDLAARGVDRIFYPHVIYERPEDEDAANSYNCPIVTGYGEVLREVARRRGGEAVPLDAPAVSFADEGLLESACWTYAKGLGVPRKRFRRAFMEARRAQADFREELIERSARLADDREGNDRMLVVLAGRPYHADPLIEHGTSSILADLGADVIPVDLAASRDRGGFGGMLTIPQWTYPNRLLRAARWVASRPDPRVQMVMLNSFGCGPDAFIMDEIRDILAAAGKMFTLVKIDEISSTGSARLRLRSMMETFRWRSRRRGPVKKERALTPSFTDADRGRTILAPHLSDFYSPLLPPLFRRFGYELEVLPPADAESAELGMKYVNNEVCYPAIVTVGDAVKALRSGRYDPDRVAVGMTQTGGQCRATNYVSLIRRALAEAGYPQVPVIAVGGSSNVINDQPGFRVKLGQVLRPTLTGMAFADALARLYYRSSVREKVPGEARRLRDEFLRRAGPLLEDDRPRELLGLLGDAVAEFNGILAHRRPLRRVGVVGEIFLKYNRFSQQGVVDWLGGQGVEVSVPSIMDFFMQYFVNMRTQRRFFIRRDRPMGRALRALMERMIRRWIGRCEKVLEGFDLYERPFSIYEKAEGASEILSLTHQYGEGWLIAGEVASFGREGIDDVVCLQPFGCISNHVIAKGIEQKVRRLHPKANLLFLDFDAGTSEVNVLNRLHFLIAGDRGSREEPREGEAAAVQSARG